MPKKQKPTEYKKVELPLMHQLAAMGWETLRDDKGDLLPGDTEVPSFTFRESFGEVLLREHLKAAIHKLNLAEDGTPWLDDERVNMAVDALERVGQPKLIESNIKATELLLKGFSVPGDPDLHGGKQTVIKYIDFDCPNRNHFLAINQFRVNPPVSVSAKNFYIPDIVLFVNGIPLVVIECKASGVTSPMEKAITQLLQYSNQRGMDQPEGVEHLFWYNQAMVATYYYKAKISTIGASYENYMEWKSLAPHSEEKVLQEVQISPLVSQHLLVGGMLRPLSLVDLVRNFTLFKNEDGRTVKIVARYQQWEAVQEAVRRLRKNATRLQDGEFDRRGGIVWHTQGSGKSLTMVFLVRKLRSLTAAERGEAFLCGDFSDSNGDDGDNTDLRRFKVVVVTDRRDLEKQLSETMLLTGETVHRAKNSHALAALLRDDAPGLIFGMIQKYRRELVREREDADIGDDEDLQRPIDPADRYEPLNDSTDILVLVDEAHRSHTDEWHANLIAALPNSARIGFTGTPIMMGAQKKTSEIFGEYIDIYNIKQSEEDKATVPILYEGHEVEAGVLDHSDLDQLFAANFEHLTPEQQEEIKNKYAREQEVLESWPLIRKKAENMLEHYIETILPNGLKAQLVAVSRLAAIRYQEALADAHQQLLERMEAMDPELAALPDDQTRTYDDETQFLIRALKHIESLRRLEFAAVVSAGQHDDPSWRKWTERTRIDEHIARFKKPLNHPDEERRDGLAFLCVRTMLLTGFDAPVEQALYLDRFMQGHELLQAIARVNRNYKDKNCGYVVDYYGVTEHLHEALAVYSQSDVEGSLKSIDEELPRLQDRHTRALEFFGEHDIQDIYDDMDACVFLLQENERYRAQFSGILKEFLTSLDIVLPRPEALPYVDDAKQLGVINRTVNNLLREEDDQAIAGVGEKVRRLIDDHIRAYHVELTIPPISIMDAEFEKHIDGLSSNRTKAAEMEHAVRYEITVNLEADPVYYEKLSVRLETILNQFEEHWDELVNALRNFIAELKQGPPIDTATQLLPEKDARKLKPFMSLFVDEMGKEVEDLTDPELQHLAGITVELAGIIREHISRKDFWSTLQLRQQLHSRLKVFIDDQVILPYEQLDAATDRIVELARRRHSELLDD